MFNSFMICLFVKPFLQHSITLSISLNSSWMLTFLGSPHPLPPTILIASLVSRFPHTTDANASQFLQFYGIPYTDVLVAILITPFTFLIYFEEIISTHDYKPLFIAFLPCNDWYITIFCLNCIVFRLFICFTHI